MPLLLLPGGVAPNQLKESISQVSTQRTAVIAGRNARIAIGIRWAVFDRNSTPPGASVIGLIDQFAGNSSNG